MSLWALGHLFRNRGEPRNHGVYRLIQARLQLVAFCYPPWIAIAKPGLPRRILPDEHFQRQIDTNLLVRLHEWRARLGITEYQEFSGPQGKASLRGACSVILRANIVRPRAVTSVTSRSIVSFGP